MAVKKSNCELCGRKEDKLSYSYVEGVKMSVCSECVKFGKYAGEIKTDSEDNKSFIYRNERIHDEKVEEVVVSDYANLIRNKRSLMGLSQKEFAMKIGERESYVASLENGKLPLSIEQAKKLGKLLGIDLIALEKSVHLVESKEKTGALTIGDLLLGKLKK